MPVLRKSSRGAPPPRRRTARASTRAQAQKSPTPPPPPQQQSDDDDMPDAPSEAPSPQDAPEEIEEVEDEVAEEEADEAEEDDDDDDEEEDEEEEEPARPATQSPARTPRVGRPSARPSIATPPVGRRRGPGRPPKHLPARSHMDGSDREASDATPRRRGGFRGGRGFGGGRWKNKNLQRQVQLPTDKEGNTVEVEGDEAVLPYDEEGETKIDRNGHLLGGREYRVRTFTIADRGERLYMLSTEPARCIGFRDSYLFFQKHKLLFKIIISDEEKHDLIERDLMPHSYKGRTIGVVTARSVFREFGAKIVIGGRKVVDDYRVADCRADGDVDGEIAVPEDRLPGPGEPYNRNQYVAWHGASAVYHNNTPSQPMQGSKIEIKKRKVTVTGSNWMLEHAREASRFNQSLTAIRRETNAGVYETYTNMLQYPRIMQPTHVRWEVVDASSQPANAPAALVNGTHAPLVNGTSHRDSSSPQRAPEPQTDAAEPSTLFAPPSAATLRNYAIVDAVFASAPSSAFPAPGLDAAAALLPGDSPGLAAVPEGVAAALPHECRAAFEQARAAELRWTSQWGRESANGMRGEVKIGYNGF